MAKYNFIILWYFGVIEENIPQRGGGGGGHRVNEIINTSPSLWYGDMKYAETVANRALQK